MDSSQATNANASEQIAEEATRMLRQSPYLEIRGLWCDYQDGVLTIRGDLSSFYQKQLAQTVVKKLDGITRIVNRAEVR